MKPVTVPLLVFAKSAATVSLPAAYRLTRNPSADERAAAEALIREISSSFAWPPSTDGSPRRPVFGLWSSPALRPGGLLLRFLDDGRDDLGRPHCLRIEAAVLKDLGEYRAELLAALLSPGAWPEPRVSPDTTATLRLTPGDQGPTWLIAGIADELASPDGRVRVLVGDSVTLALPGWRFLRPVRPPDPPMPVAEAKSVVRGRALELSRKGFGGLGMARTVGSPKLAWFLAAMLAFALALVGAVWYRTSSELTSARERVLKLETRDRDLAGERDDLKAQLSRLNSTLAEREDELARARQDADEQRRLVRESDPAGLKRQIQALREANSQVQRKLNEALAILRAQDSANPVGAGRDQGGGNPPRKADPPD